MNRHSAQQFRAQLAHGRVYEVAVARWLQGARGYTTLPIFDCVGRGQEGAPCLEGSWTDDQKGRLIAPDILACKAGLWTWFEVKVKERAVLHRLSGTRVTGLPWRHWQDYHAVRRVTHSPVWLIFVQLHEQEVVGREIGAITPHNIDGTAAMNAGGTVFFEYTALQHLISLDTLNIYKEDRHDS